ncbi:MAG: CotH kinase family protein [Eubacteriales bacterium]
MISTVDQTPPITVVADKTNEYGCRVGTDIEFYESGGDYYLFLPSSAELSEVMVRYDGNLQLYDPTYGELYEPGSVVSLDFSGEKTYIYEYNSENNLYLRYPVRVMAGENIASVYITLDNAESGLRRINSSKGITEQGSILMTEANGKTLYNGDLEKIKGHGNTSYNASGSANTKNSYNINLGTKAELIEGAGRSKKWTLLRIRTWDNYDPTGVSYLVGFYTFNALVGEDYFNITARYVDVYINGEYRGVYVLTERMDMNGSIEVTDLEAKITYTDDKFRGVGRNSTDDPAIKAGIESYTYSATAELEEGTDITGGYVLEVMCGTYGECGFKTKKGMFINIKSPSHPTQEQVCYIAEYVQNFENALFSDTGYNELGKHYTEYIDVPSYAAQALAYAYYLNWEIYRTSTYMYKDVDGSTYDTITFGPVWDFESGAGVMMNDKTLLGSTFSYTERQQYIWYEQFWRKADFIKYLASMNSGMQTVIDTLMGKTESRYIFSLKDMFNSVEASQNMNWVRWELGDSFSTRSKEMKNGLTARYDCWFNDLWNGENYLLGATVTSEKTSDGYLLTAQTVGQAEGYQWYKLEGDMTQGVEIEGANDKTYLAKDSGIYYCGVSGKNNAYWRFAAGKIFKKPDIEMFTDPVSVNEEITLAISTPDSYELGSEPETTAGLPPVGEYVYTVSAVAETADTDGLYEIVAEEEKIIVGDGDMAYIIFASVIAAVSAAAVVVAYAAAKKKGGEGNA